jgi:hypothetical protein
MFEPTPARFKEDHRETIWPWSHIHFGQGQDLIEFLGSKGERQL